MARCATARGDAPDLKRHGTHQAAQPGRRRRDHQPSAPRLRAGVQAPARGRAAGLSLRRAPNTFGAVIGAARGPECPAVTTPTLRPDRLLEGEDAKTLFARDARHWIGVYQQMIGFKEDLLGRIRTQLAHLPAVARADVIDNDINALEEQLLRYRRRLEFWYALQWHQEGLTIDHDGRIITYHDRVISRTEREFQLHVIMMNLI